MLRPGLLAAACVLTVLAASAAHAAPLSCAQAAAAAEAEAGIPPSLLLAIGVIESGRAAPAGGRAPWPWTINAGGIGHYFESADEAVAAVRQLRASGQQSVDIGCFQVNVYYHPEAFTDLESGFDPLINAKAAAQFLNALHSELGSWERAVAAYHSRVEAIGGPYKDQVFSAWQNKPESLPVISIGWSRRADIAPGIHVWGPAGSLGVIKVAAQPGLPRVITPSFR